MIPGTLDSHRVPQTATRPDVMLPYDPFEGTRAAGEEVHLVHAEMLMLNISIMKMKRRRDGEREREEIKCIYTHGLNMLMSQSQSRILIFATEEKQQIV